MRKRWLLQSKIASMVCLSLAGCTTQAKFVLPSNATLEIEDRSVQARDDGTISTEAFSWGALGLPPTAGARYRLVQEGGIVNEGRLRTEFRFQSIFWPPLIGVFLYPVGLDGRVTYDLIHGTQVEAPPPE
jgi:hypothetical protein